MNWERSIRRVLKGGEFTEKERTAAMGWNQCAVGEAHIASPKIVLLERDDETDEVYAPLDPMLAKLGADFADSVCGNEYEGLGVSAPKAARTYAAIQARVAELTLLKKFKVEPEGEDA